MPKIQKYANVNFSSFWLRKFLESGFMFWTFGEAQKESFIIAVKCPDFGPDDIWLPTELRMWV